MHMLILAATGGFGAAMTQEALARGHQVTALVRNPGRLAERLGTPERLTVVTAGTLEPEALRATATGADVLVFAVNVSYEQWEPFMETALTATLDALTPMKRPPLLVFPGNVYALGPQHGPDFDEHAPNRPSMRKGRLRARLEARLKAASAAGIWVLIPRCADFFGPTVRNGFTDRLFGHASLGKPMEVIGSGAGRHQFTYVPDAARATMDLIEQGQPTPFHVVNMPTHEVPSITSLTTEIARVADRPALKLRKTPWFILRLLGLKIPLLRELVELRYLFEEGVHLNSDKLMSLLPGFTVTPLETAVAETLSSYRADTLKTGMM